MKFTEVAKGIWIIEPVIHGDKRGWLYESFRVDEFQKHGLNADFKVEKEGKIEPGVVDIGDSGYLVSVNKGKAKVVAGNVEIEISGSDKKQVYVEKGIKCSLEVMEHSDVALKSRS